MSDLPRDLEAILFVAHEPLSLTQLASAVNVDVTEVKSALTKLSHRLTGGIRLVHHNGEYQLSTSAESSDAVSRFLQQEAKNELSRAALETLAIIAYRGPITKTEIEAIRGVASDTMLKNLLARGLIVESGRAKSAGRSILYSVHHTFLEQFGLTSLDELPPLEESAS